MEECQSSELTLRGRREKILKSSCMDKSVASLRISHGSPVWHFARGKWGSLLWQKKKEQVLSSLD